MNLKNRNSIPICDQIPLSNTVHGVKSTKSKQSSLNLIKNDDYDELEEEEEERAVNNQTVNLDDNDTNVKNNNLNMTVNLDQVKKPINTHSNNNVKLNVTIDIEDETDNEAATAKAINEKLNITIDKNKTQEIVQPTVLNTNFAPIPNSFDMFADDLNKQSGLTSPTSSSSASSSTSSLTSNKLYYNNNSNRGVLPAQSKLANYKLTSIKILTSSVDKDLNKIAVAKEEPIKSPLTSSQARSKLSRLSTYGHPPQPTQVRSSIPTGLPKPTSQVLRNATNNNTNTVNPNIKVIYIFPIQI